MAKLYTCYSFCQNHIFTNKYKFSKKTFKVLNNNDGTLINNNSTHIFILAILPIKIFTLAVANLAAIYGAKNF